MSDLNRLVWQSNGYWTIAEETPFAREFNARSKQFWVYSGTSVIPGDLAMDILVDDYNKRHKEEPNHDNNR